MLVLEGYGQAGKVMYKSQTYTVLMYTKKGKPSESEVKKIFQTGLKPLVEFVSITSNTKRTPPEYSIVFKPKTKELSAKMLANNIKLHFDKYQPISSVIGGEVKTEKPPSLMEIPKGMVKTIISAPGKAIETAKFIAPSFGTIKLVLIAGGTIAALAFLSPYFKTATKIAGLSGEDDE